MNPSLATLAVIACAYLLGSVSFAVVASKLFRLPDPRSYGSGNPGATNVLRTGNKAAAAVTLAGDALKGTLAVWLAYRLGASWGDASLATAGAALADVVRAEFGSPWVRVSVAKLAPVAGVKRLGVVIERGER